MSLQMSKPLDTSDPLLMSDAERRAFMAPDPDHAMRMGIMMHAEMVSASGYRGVSKASYGSKFFAQIRAHGTYYYLGTFPTALDAARAYDAKAKELHGDLAILNFPEAMEVAA